MRELRPEFGSPEYWGIQVEASVAFAPALRAIRNLIIGTREELGEEDMVSVVEVGAHSVLSLYCSLELGDVATQVVSTLRRDKPGPGEYLPLCC